VGVRRASQVVLVVGRAAVVVAVAGRDARVAAVPSARSEHLHYYASGEPFPERDVAAGRHPAAPRVVPLITLLSRVAQAQQEYRP